MADPHIQSQMDKLDYLTVVIYRLGFTFSTPLIAFLPWYSELSLHVFVAAAMCASSLHIYLKSFRLLLQMATWVGLLCAILGFPMLGLGGVFITLGGLCFKEQYCFKVPGLQYQSIILALLWFSLYYEQAIAAKIFAGIAGLLFFIITIAKWRMPLYFDIGDKTKYEV